MDEKKFRDTMLSWFGVLIQDEDEKLEEAVKRVRSGEDEGFKPGEGVEVVLDD